jgi:hypothetical protein
MPGGASAKLGVFVTFDQFIGSSSQVTDIGVQGELESDGLLGTKIVSDRTTTC